MKSAGSVDRRSFLTGAAGPKRVASLPWYPPYSKPEDFLRRVSFGLGPQSPDLGKWGQAYKYHLRHQLGWHPGGDSPVEAQIATKLKLLHQPISKIYEHKTEALELQEVTLALAAATAYRRIYSEGQLYEVMVKFWHDHFNVPYQVRGYVSRIGALQHDRNIRPHALTTFQDLLLSVVESPPLLLFLDNQTSIVNKLNENFGRELLELYTFGAYDSTGKRNYTEEDVINSSKIMTGWGADRHDDGEKRFNGNFKFFKNRHDKTRRLKVDDWQRPGDNEFLDHGRHYLRHLAQHEKTADHICTKLALFFIGADAPRAVIDRMTDAWASSNSDIRVVLTTLLESEEFEASLGRGRRSYGKVLTEGAAPLRRPMDHFVAAARAVDGSGNPSAFVYEHFADISDDEYDIEAVMHKTTSRHFSNMLATRHVDHGWIAPDGYPLSRDYWLTPSGMVNRFSVAAGVAHNQVPLCVWNPADMLDRVVAERPDPDLAAALARVFLRQEPHPRLVAEIRTLIGDKSVDELRTIPGLHAVRQAAVLCFSSPQFQTR